MIIGAGPRLTRNPALFLAVFLLLPAAPAVPADDFRITDLRAEFQNCPNSLKDIKIAFISDIHLSEANSTRHVFTELTDRINRLKPDLLLLGGDIFHGIPGRKTDPLEQIWRQFMARLETRPPLGIFAVLGNHDKREDANEIRLILERSGVHVLSQDVIPIRTQDAVLYLAGTDSTPDESLPPTFLRQLTDRRPIILLAHYPEIFDLIPDNTQILVLAGHTHGGLIHIPGVKRGSLVSAVSPAHRTKYMFGFYGERGGRQLYVSAGVAGEGRSGLRIGNPPEIVVIRPEQNLTAAPRETDHASPGAN